MAKYAIGPDLSAVPDGYDGYYTDIATAQAAASDGDELIIVGENDLSVPITKGVKIGTDATLSSTSIINASGSRVIELSLKTLELGAITLNLNNFSAQAIRSTQGADIVFRGTKVKVLGTTTTLFASGIAGDFSFLCDKAEFDVTATAAMGSGYFFLPSNAATWTFTVIGSTFNISCDSGSANFFGLSEQPNPRFVGNTFYNRRGESAGGLTLVRTAATSGARGTSNLNGNTVYSYPVNGTMLTIGTDAEATAASEKNNYEDATLNDNIIYGPAYLNKSLIGESIVTAHGLLCGNVVDTEICRNKLYGFGYAIVVKGAGDDDTTDDWGGTKGPCFNYIHNPRIGINIKGQHNVITAHNTIIIEGSGLSYPYLIGPTTVSGTMLKNNATCLISGSIIAFIDISDASADLTSDHNVFIKAYNAQLTTGFAEHGETAYATFSDWVAAGYDADSYYIEENENGDWDVYHGSDPERIVNRLNICPIKTTGDIVETRANPLVGTAEAITGVNDGGRLDCNYKPLRGSNLDIGALSWQPASGGGSSLILG